jgi:hypothetical protein
MWLDINDEQRILLLTEIIWLLTSAGKPYHPSTAPRTKMTIPDRTSHAGVCFLSDTSAIRFNELHISVKHEFVQWKFLAEDLALT